MKVKIVILLVRILWNFVFIPAAMAAGALIVLTVKDIDSWHLFSLASTEKFLIWVVSFGLIFSNILQYFFFMRNKKWWHSQEELEDAIEYHKRKSEECRITRDDLVGLILKNERDDDVTMDMDENTLFLEESSNKEQ